MADHPPTHSPDSYYEGATPVQSFINVWKPVGPEERNRPRYGRPVRPPEPATPPVGDGSVPVPADGDAG